MIFLIAAMILAAFVVALLASGWKEISAFESSTGRLQAAEWDGNRLFPSGSLGNLANDYLAAFAKAKNREVLPFFHVDQALGPVSTYLRSISLVPRALIGILILLALIVTLANLQGAVGALGSAFRELSTNTARTSIGAPNKAVDTIQQAMSTVATAASNAFQTSGAIILIAAILLGAATALQWQSQRAFRGFSRWAHMFYLDSLPDPNRHDLGDQIRGLGGAVAKLEPLVASLADLGKGLTAFASLEARMDDFSESLKEALDRLPQAFEAGLEARMDRLSGSVAQGIHSEIQHQIEYILRIVKIYGDQELRIKEIHGFMAQTLEQVRTQSSSLQALSKLAPTMEKFADSVVEWSRQADVLAKGIALLDERVNRLPVTDISSSAEELRHAAQSLGDMQTDFGGMSEAVKSIREEVAQFISSWKSEFSSDLNDIVKHVRDEIRVQIAPRLTDLEKAIQANDTAAIREHVRLLKDEVQRVSTTMGDVRMDQEFDQLNRILHDLSEFTKEPGIKHFFRGRRVTDKG